MMKLNSNIIEDHKKLTELMFDEVKICRTIEYDVIHDEIVDPDKPDTGSLTQGIASKWKQPICVDFDVKMTKTILNDIIN